MFSAIRLLIFLSIYIYTCIFVNESKKSTELETLKFGKYFSILCALFCAIPINYSGSLTWDLLTIAIFVLAFAIHMFNAKHFHTRIKEFDDVSSTD